MAYIKYNGIFLKEFNNKETLDFIDAAGLNSDSNLNVDGLYTAEQLRMALEDLVQGHKNYGLWSKCIALFPYVAGTEQASTLNIKNINQNMTWNGTIIFDKDGISSNSSTALDLNNYGTFSIAPMPTNNLTLVSYIGNKTPDNIGQNISRTVLSDTTYSVYNRLNIFRDTTLGISGNIGTTQTTSNFTSNGYKGFQSLTRTNNTQIRCWSNGRASAQSPISTPIQSGYETTGNTFVVLNYNPQPSRLSLHFSGIYEGLTNTELSILNFIIEQFERSIDRSPFLNI